MAFLSLFPPLKLRASKTRVSNVKGTVCTAETDIRTRVAALVAGVSLLAAPVPADASLFHFAAPRPSNIGLNYERYLNFCPQTPNCISSMANVYDSHFVPAWTYAAGPEKAPKKKMAEAIQDVVDVVEAYPGATIITKRESSSDVGKGYYIYAEFETPLMGFVDDVEFLFQPDGKTVEYRSASRIGENDLSANRKRIKDLRVALQDKDNRWASEGY